MRAARTVQPAPCRPPAMLHGPARAAPSSAITSDRRHVLPGVVPESIKQTNSRFSSPPRSSRATTTCRRSRCCS
eukprot:13102723-Heterocapsa_arctica.AAC.1